MKAFLKKHYEKILLAILLTVFICLLAFQLVLWKQSEQIQVEKLKGFREPPPNYVTVKFDAKESPFNVLAHLPAMPLWDSSRPREGKRTFTDFMSPFPLALCPHCFRVIPSDSFPAPNTVALGKCPLCNKNLAAPTRYLLAENLDTDGDGIPDKEEVALGLNPKDSTDGAVDSDADGFTNYEEYVYKTKINDPKSRPDYHEKMFVRNITRAKLPFTLKNISFTDRKDKSSASIQIELQVRRRGGFRTHNIYTKNKELFSTLAGNFIIMDVIADFSKKSNGLEENNSRIILRKQGSQDKITLEIGKPVYEPREKIELCVAKANDLQELELYIGSKFSVGTLKTNIDSYEVVAADQQKKAVTLRFEKNGKNYEIQSKSALQQRLEKIKRPPQPAKRLNSQNVNI